MKIPQTDFFVMEEFLPKADYARIAQIKKDSERLQEFYKLVNPKIVLLADFLRQYFDAPIKINTWHTGGNLQYRGWRPKDCVIGAKNSEHKKGNALDFNVSGKTDKEVKDIIIANQPLFYAKNARRIEDYRDATTWTHIDIKDTGIKNQGTIVIFRA